MPLLRKRNNRESRKKYPKGLVAESFLEQQKQRDLWSMPELPELLFSRQPPWCIDNKVVFESTIRT